jgi:hypothetical protein
LGNRLIEIGEGVRHAVDGGPFLGPAEIGADQAGNLEARRAQCRNLDAAAKTGAHNDGDRGVRAHVAFLVGFPTSTAARHRGQ